MAHVEEREEKHIYHKWMIYMPELKSASSEKMKEKKRNEINPLINRQGFSLNIEMICSSRNLIEFDGLSFPICRFRIRVFT